MNDELPRLRRELEQSLLQGRGRTQPSLRKAAHDRGALPEELRALVEKVHEHAYQVTDEEVAALRGRYSDDELYEILVCAAAGAAAERLDAGLRALDAADKGDADAAAQG